VRSGNPDAQIDLGAQLAGSRGRALIPACGQLDADGPDELLVALGPTADGRPDHRVLLRDDATAGDAPLGLLLPQLQGNGGLWPATAPAHASGPRTALADCLTNAECGGGQHCAKPIGDCAGYGICTDRPEVCLTVVDEVCGCDGQTYGNACEAAGAGVNLQGRGVCL
jgi:hypothetical protein